jgi:restriction system protein
MAKPRGGVITYDRLMQPTLDALRTLGGSGTIDEIYTKVTEIAQIPQEQLDILHAPEKSTQTEIEYRLAWARTYLKKYGLLENSNRGVWALTPKGLETRGIDPQVVVQFVRDNNINSETNDGMSQPEIDVDPLQREASIEQTWRDKAISSMLSMSPEAFERLIQRFLRESGFVQVEVTGRTGDQGIDGKGIIRVGGVLSFHILFQCKRYKGTVSSSEIRDFRGAMQGRADKGLFITTGNFSRESTKEATRDGAPPIDLLDGERLADRLKELSLGIKTTQKVIEEVTVDEQWFLSFNS